MLNHRQISEVAPSLYSEDFFCHCNDGFEEFREGKLSYIKEKAGALLDIRKDFFFLDIGCGRGELLLHAAAKGARPFGIDYSEAALRITRGTLRHSSAAPPVLSDAAFLPFADDLFDCIWMGDIIEHVSRPKGIRLMTEARRVLKPGGKLLLHTSPNALFMKWVFPAMILFAGRRKRAAILEHVAAQSKVHVHEYHYFSLKQLAGEAGIAPRIWIDEDLLRGGQFRHLKDLCGLRRKVVSAAQWLVTKAGFPLKLFLGNDLWLEYIKPARP